MPSSQLGSAGAMVLGPLALLLGSASSALPSQATDWLVHPVTTPTRLEANAADNTLVLTNGLISRAFFLQHGSGAFCTVDLRQEPSAQSFFRAISPEANLTLSIEKDEGDKYHHHHHGGGPSSSSSFRFDVGGCIGQPLGHYEFFDADALLGNLSANASAFQYRNHTTAPPETLFPWAPRHGAPTNIPWPPKGLQLTVDFVPPASAPAAIEPLVVSVHYEMYDGLPALRKWVTVAYSGGGGSTIGAAAAAAAAAPGGGSGAIVIDTLHYELLRAPNWAPEHMTVTRQAAGNPTPYDEEVRPDRAHVEYLGRTIQNWHADPLYDQRDDQELHVPYSAYTLLAVGYEHSNSYGGPTGPGVKLAAPGDTFESLSVRLTFHDGTEVTRQGLGVRQMLRTLAPSLNEAPLLGMLTDASSSHALRTYVDQMAETGHELAIIGFGAKGWCGMCDAQLTNASFKAWMRGEVAYATSKGIGLSAYTLMQHNGWGEVTPKAEQTLNRDGTRGPTACFATDYHAHYRSLVLDFVHDVGLVGLETDGQFEGIACADESHDHHHNGLAGGWSHQMEATLSFNKQLKGMGIYQTGADGYAWSGAQRWNHADTDAFSKLPLWEQFTVGRMYTYDSTVNRVPTSGQLFVQDLYTSVTHPAHTPHTTPRAAAGGCPHGLSRLACFDFLLGALYILAGQPQFHAARLYDPADPERAQIVATIRKWTGFFKAMRHPRPSGAPGLLVAQMVHLVRPSARDLEAVLYVSPDASAPERALVAICNPTRRALRRTLTLPLWYSGLPPGTKLHLAPFNFSTTGGDQSLPGLARADGPAWGSSAVARQPFASGQHASETHVLGADPGAGFTDVVLKVDVPPASYVLLLGSV